MINGSFFHQNDSSLYEVTDRSSSSPMYFVGSVLRLPTHHSLVGVPLLYKSLSLPAFFELPSSSGTRAHYVLGLVSTQDCTSDGSERYFD